ncbi:MAG TPA: hypothetical protein VFF30_01220 [Nitrososphaerales archaeon]|nr:hypothetical protein [Nitrososphaerales archaeon]
MQLPIYVYAAYWAFSARQALAVRLYRNQSLGIGLIVLAFWASLGSGFTPGSAPLQLRVALIQVSFILAVIVLFYWIDASLLASRRSDPLLRDTFRWSNLRIPFWIANIIMWGLRCRFSPTLLSQTMSHC